MQFLKKHITELCFMLLLCGTLWGAAPVYHGRGFTAYPGI